tara:strand:+ start:95 stop:649 length:555 start_codon:yes stop_codon:yes gene_type:complete
MTKQTYNELKNRIHVLEYENAELTKNAMDSDKLFHALSERSDYVEWFEENEGGCVVDYIAHLEKANAGLVDEVEGKNINIEMLEKEVEMSMENHNEILLESLGNTDFFDWCNTGKEEVVDYIEHLEKEVEEMTVAMSIGCDIDDAHWKVRRTQTDDWVKMFKTNEQLKKANDELKEINKTLMKN